MLRISKRILATILATAMVFTMADYSGIHLLVENVSASTDQNKYSDSKVVNEEIIPDTELRNALKDIISNGNDLTFKELKEYEVAQKPQRDNFGLYEYVDQHCGYCEDDFYGTIYTKTPLKNRWLERGYNY